MISSELLNFCKQSWYVDVSSWARTSCKKISLLSSWSRSQWGLIQSDMTVSTISTELLTLLQPNFISWYIIIAVVSCVKIGLLWSRSRSHLRFNLSVPYFCTTDIFATKLDLMKCGLTDWGSERCSGILFGCTHVKTMSVTKTLWRSIMWN